MTTASDPGEVFMHDIAALPIFRPESTENDNVSNIKDFEDDDSQFNSASINSVLEGDISDHRGTQAGTEQNENVPNKDNESSAKSRDFRPSNASEDLPTGDVDMVTISIPGEPPPHQITRATTSSNKWGKSIPKGSALSHFKSCYTTC